MKAINNFFNNTSIWKVYIVMWFITGSFMFGLFHFLPLLMTEEAKNPIGLIIQLKIGAVSGLVLGLMATLMISIARSSQRFWDYSKVVQALVNKATTKEQLRNIYNTEFKKLHSMGGYGPQSNELTKIYTMIETMIGFYNENKIEPIVSKEKFTDKFECKIDEDKIPDTIKNAILAIDNTATFDNGIIRSRLHYDTIMDILNTTD